MRITSSRLTAMILRLLTMLLLVASLLAAPLHWTPANFRGLALGRTQRADAVRLLGPPDAVNHTSDREELLYKARGDHRGDLIIRLGRSGVRTGVIVEIQESFPVAIPRSRIYKELGPDAMTARYSLARCAGDVLYRDPRGTIELTLYSARGIYLWPDQYGYDFAALHYAANPPGFTNPPACVARR